MIVPGSNLLAIALGVIAPQIIAWEKFTGRVTGETGIDVSSYDEPVNIQGSFQPVNKELYQRLGLDFKMNHAILYTTALVSDVERDSSGDRFTWNNSYWQATSNQSWQSQDGWGGLMCVQVSTLIGESQIIPNP